VHVPENPIVPGGLKDSAVILTVILGGLFLLGLNEAVGVAIPLVAVYLLLNAAAVVAAGFARVFSEPSLTAGWTDRLLASAGGGPWT
jgi:hypothetical protein